MKKYSLIALYLFCGEAIIRFLGFFANVYLGRTLGPSGFGLIIIGTSLLTSALLISDSGLRMVGLVETAKADGQRQFSFSDIVLSRAFHGLLSFILLSGFVFIFYPQYPARIICLLYLLNIFSDALFIEWYYNGLQRFKTIAIIRICTTAIYVSSLSFIIHSSADITRVPILFFITNMTGVMLLYILQHRTSTKFRFAFSLNKYIVIISHALPLGIGTFFNQVTMFLPPLILGKFFNETETGFYGAALKIVMLVMSVDKIFSTIFLSSLPKLWHKNQALAIKKLQTLVHLTLTGGAFISLQLCIFAKPAIQIVFGSAYNESVMILSLMSWFFTLTLLNSIFAFGLIAIDRKKQYLYATAIGFAFNCISIPVLVVLYGKIGAAGSILIGEFVFILLCHKAFHRFARLSLSIPFLKTALVSVCSYASIFITGTTSSIFMGTVASSIFIAGAVLLKIISKDDLALLVNAQWNKQ